MRVDEIATNPLKRRKEMTAGMYRKALAMVDQRLDAGDSKLASVKNKLIQSWKRGDTAINKYDKNLLSAGIKMDDLV